MKTHNTFRLIHFAIIGLIISVIAQDYFGLWSAINTDCSLILCFKHQHSLEFYNGSVAFLFFCFLALESIYPHKIGLWIKNNALATSILAFIGIVICLKQIMAQPFEFGIMSYDLNEEQLALEYRTIGLYFLTYLSMVLIAYTESNVSKYVRANHDSQVSKQSS